MPWIGLYILQCTYMLDEDEGIIIATLVYSKIQIYVVCLHYYVYVYESETEKQNKQEYIYFIDIVMFSFQVSQLWWNMKDKVNVTSTAE